jgi:hypothetical protein
VPKRYCVLIINELWFAGYDFGLLLDGDYPEFPQHQGLSVTHPEGLSLQVVLAERVSDPQHGLVTA